jgi:hypothetical protein
MPSRNLAGDIRQARDECRCRRLAIVDADFHRALRRSGNARLARLRWHGLALTMPEQ